MIVTDELQAYPRAMMGAAPRQQARNHPTQRQNLRARRRAYEHRGISIFPIEAWIVGNFHKVSIKHLQRYLNEFEYRFNRRSAKAEDAFIETVRRLAGFKPLPFDVLTAEKV